METCFKLDFKRLFDTFISVVFRPTSASMGILVLCQDFQPSQIQEGLRGTQIAPDFSFKSCCHSGADDSSGFCFTRHKKRNLSLSHPPPPQPPLTKKKKKKNPQSGLGWWTPQHSLDKQYGTTVQPVLF